MANSYETVAQLLLKTDKNNDFKVDQVISSTPFLNLLPARPASHGTRETFLRTTAYPTTVIHGISEGKDYDHSTEEQVDVDLKFFNAGVQGTVAAAQVFGDETSYILDQGTKSFKGLMFKIEDMVINGTLSDANGPEGFADLLDSLSNEMVVDGGGSGSDECSSVYLVRYADENGAFVTTKGSADIGVPYNTIGTGSNNKDMAVIALNISAWVASGVKTKYSVSRIANLTAANGLTDALLEEALAKHPAGFTPDVIVMNRQQRKLLQQSRSTALIPNPMTPTVSADGIPIVISEVIRNDEAAIV